MKALCKVNFFGNPHFTTGKIYEIKSYNKTHIIETDFLNCPLMLNLKKQCKQDKVMKFSFGTLCEFEIIEDEEKK